MPFFSFITGAKPPLIEQSLQHLGVMLDTSERMFEAATDCLLDNEPVTVDLAALDDVVNENEQTIRRAVLEHIAMDPRAETSLSLLLVAIVQDAERLGDLAKSISKVSALADAPRMGRHVEALRPIRNRVQTTFRRVREAFIQGDAQAARRVMEEHDETKVWVADFLRDLAAAADVTPNQAVVLGVASRMIGRTSSHLSNIISAVALPFDQVRNAPTWDVGD